MTAVVVHTLPEAAAILRVKPSWLERRAAARGIPFTMLGGAYHFTPGHLAAIIAQHEKQPALAVSSTGDRPQTARRAPQSAALGSLQSRPLIPRPRRAA